jgi:hypothetical protein
MRNFTLPRGPCNFLNLRISPWEVLFLFLLCSSSLSVYPLSGVSLIRWAAPLPGGLPLPPSLCVERRRLGDLLPRVVLRGVGAGAHGGVAARGWRLRREQARWSGARRGAERRWRVGAGGPERRVAAAQAAGAGGVGAVRRPRAAGGCGSGGAGAGAGAGAGRWSGSRRGGARAEEGGLERAMACRRACVGAGLAMLERSPGPGAARPCVGGDQVVAGAGHGGDGASVRRLRSGDA